MSGLGTNRVQSLAEWLEIATAGLVLPAKERIRLEIEAHFAEGVDNHHANGSSEANAQAAVLAELGDATAAAKRFRRRHLTEKEEKRVDQLLKSVSGPIWLLVSYFVYGCFYVYSLHILRQYHAPRVFPTVALLMSAGLETIGFFVTRRKSSAPDLRLLFLTHILSDGCFMLFFVSLFIWGDWALGLAILLGQTITLIPDLRIWFKLGQVDNTWPEIPSRGAPAP